MGVVSDRLRASARGQKCTVGIVGVCRDGDHSTTVLAHLPSDVAGKATKSDDWHACFACHACHDALDQHRLDAGMASWYALRALQQTQRIWFEMGLLTIAGEKERKARPLNKIVPRPEKFRR